jgi:23S rRNA pseudouridine1911/1915/1917 synthase
VDGGPDARAPCGARARDVATGEPTGGRRVAFITGPDATGRLDLLVATETGLSRTQAATLIATGCVTVEGRREKASYRPRSGERIAVDVPIPKERAVLPESIPLRVVYEDGDLLVVDKPAGMVVHPAPGHWTGTLVNALLGREDTVPVASDPVAERSTGPVVRAGLIHRLDKDTSGLLLVAKTDRAHRRLSAALAQRQIRRLYAAVTWGHLREDRLTVERPIGRDPRDRKRMAIVNTGRPARTDIERLARFESADLLRARLLTGRTHQIRVHLASVGHPVVGDDTYGGGGGRRLVALPPRRHFLHAAWLLLRHPITGEPMDLRSPLPGDLETSLAAVAGWDQARDGEASRGDPLEYLGFYRLNE